MRRKTQQQFIEEAKKVHGDRYDYSLLEYKGSKSKVKIICKDHGVFEQIPSSHINGCECMPCAIIKRANSQSATKYSFVKKAILKHRNKYDYSLVQYKTAKIKVKIKCPIHGDFNQTPDNHLTGFGCKECAIDLSRKKPTTWTKKDWSVLAKSSKYFDSFKVYIIRCYDENEDFYKIGRTYNTVKKRMSGNLMPYNYEIIKEYVFENSEECFNYENELKTIHKEYKYLPNKLFGGRYECFYKINE